MAILPDDVPRCGIDDACVDQFIRRKQLSVLGIFGSSIDNVCRNCTEVQGFAVREQGAYRLSHHRSDLFIGLGCIGHSVLVGDADMARIHRIGIGADKFIQDLPCLLAGAGGIRKYIHSGNIVFVMKHLSFKKQEEIKKLVYEVMVILRTNINDIEVVGKGYDALSRIVKATNSQQDYLDWLIKQVADDVDYKYSKEGSI